MRAARRFAAIFAAIVVVAVPGTARADCGGWLEGILAPSCPPSPTAPDPGGQEEPDQPVPAPGKHFGFNSSLAFSGLAAPEEELDRAGAAGVTVHRVPVVWRGLQPDADDPPLPAAADGNTVDLIDRFYAAALERGITPIFTTYWAPTWATRYRRCGLLDLGCQQMARSDAKLVPDWPFLDEYETFVRAVKTRWPRALIEPWNEPNLYWQHPAFRGSRSFAAAPEHLAAIQCAAHRGSKSVNDDPVLSAGWAARRFAEYVGAVYAAAGGACWDVVNIHIQSSGLGENTAFAQSLHDTRVLRQQHSDASPIWVTEIGWSTSGRDRVSEEEQADLSRRAYNRLTTMPDVEAVLFHTLRDSPLSSYPYNDPGHAEYGYGFLREDWRPKPVYCHFTRQAGNAVDGC